MNMQSHILMLIICNNIVSVIVKMVINIKLILWLKLILKEVSFFIFVYNNTKYKSRVINVAIKREFKFIIGINDKIIIKINLHSSYLVN